MSQPQTGDLIFYSGITVWSRLIRLRTLSRWSHVGILIRNEAAGMSVVESLEGIGVRIVPICVWDMWPGDIGWASVPATPEQRERIADHGITQVGCGYASAVQFVRSFSWLWRRGAVAVGLPVDVNPSRYFCSELAAEALQVGGVDLPGKPSRISPGRLAERYHVRRFQT